MNRYQHRIGACLLFKDSAPYLNEWLLFHSIQGVEHFYLYNNESGDEYREVLKPWIRAERVTLIDYPGRAIQTKVYDDCLDKTRGRVKWLAFLDDDEFLFPVTESSLEDVLDQYSAYAGVAVCWVLFGSAGFEDQSEEWVIKRFTRSSGFPDRHVKCLVRPERVVRSLTIGHEFEPCAGYQIVDEAFSQMTSPFADRPNVSRLRINHYLVKSWEEWRNRRGRPQANTGEKTPHSEASWRDWDKLWSAVSDEAIGRFLPSMMAANRDGSLMLKRARQ